MSVYIYISTVQTRALMSLADAMEDWLQNVDTLSTDECQLKFCSIMLALRKVVSEDEAKAITKAMIRTAGAKHDLISLFTDSFFESDFFKFEGGTGCLPLAEMRRYKCAYERIHGSAPKLVLAEPGAPLIEVNMPVHMPDEEEARMWRRFLRRRRNVPPRVYYINRHVVSQPYDEEPAPAAPASSAPAAPTREE